MRRIAALGHTAEMVPDTTLDAVLREVAPDEERQLGAARAGGQRAGAPRSRRRLRRTSTGSREPELGTLALAASEALTNSVLHAFPAGSQPGTITARVDVDRDARAASRSTSPTTGRG